jgi:hypothetical protein
VEVTNLKPLLLRQIALDKGSAWGLLAENQLPENLSLDNRLDV